MEKKRNSFLLFLCSVSLFSIVAVKTREIKPVKAADKVFAYGDVIEYDPTTITVSYDREGPDANDVYGSNMNSDVYYQGRAVQLDPGKAGLLIKSKKHGVAAEGATFRLGGAYMSGPFSIDFRVFSKNTYHQDTSIPLEETLSWDAEELNPYLDLRKLSFKFTSYVDPSVYFKVYFYGTSRYHRVSVQTYVELGGILQKPFRSKFYSNGSNGSFNYNSSTDATQTRQVADNEDYYWMTIPGTSFCNITDIGTWMYTEGCASTVLKLDPATGDLSTEKYYKTGEPTGADIYVSPYYKTEVAGAPNSGQTKNYYRQVFNGNYASVKEPESNLILNMRDGSAKNLSGLYKKLVPEVTQEEMLQRFATLLEKYTVDVTFEDVTNDKTPVIPNIPGEPTVYNRYAQMLIYSLNGKPLTGEFKDTTPPRVVLQDKLEDGEVGQEYLLPTPFAEDSYDTQFKYQGYAVVKDPDGDDVIVTENKFTPIKSGTYLVSWKNIKDAAGNEALVERTVNVPSAFVYSDNLIDCAVLGEDVTIPTATVIGNSTTVKVFNPSGGEELINNNKVTVNEKGLYTVQYTANVSGSTVVETKQFEVFKTLQSKFITNYSDDFVVTNGYVSTKEKDRPENGLLITTKKSGDAAEGSKLTLVENMNGKFSIDFRVLSEVTLDHYVSETGVRTEDSSNVYLDLRRLGFVFTAENGDTFTVYIRGLELYWNYMSSAAVQTGDMPDAFGIKYNDSNLGISTVNDESFGYNTCLLGSTFCNYTSSDAFLVDGKITTTYFEFDPNTMIVAGKRVHNSAPNIVTIRDLSDAQHVFGSQNVLTSFSNYKVEMFIDEMTSNSTKINGETHDRYGNIVIYTLNGQKLSYNADGLIEDNTAPIILSSKLIGNEGDKIDVSPVVYDLIDEKVSFEGKVYYVEPNSEVEHEITPEGGKYFLNASMCGNFVVKYRPTNADASGNALVETDRIIYIVDRSAPEVKLVDGIPNEIVVDFGVDSVPEFKESDVIATDNVSRQCSVRIVVSGPTEDFSKVGEYIINYIVSDEAGNSSTLQRKIIIKDNQKPTITTNIEDITVNQWTTVEIPLVEATDNLDKVILVSVQVMHGDEEIETDGIEFVAEKDGEYTITFYATDKAGNESSKQMKVTVNKAEKPTHDDPTSDITSSENPSSSDSGNNSGKKGCGSAAIPSAFGLFTLLGCLLKSKNKK